MNYLEETEMRMLEAIENLEKRLITIRAGRILWCSNSIKPSS